MAEVGETLCTSKLVRKSSFTGSIRTGNRVLVQSRIYDVFAKALIDKVKTLKVGPGTELDVFIGPFTHERAVDKEMGHIEGN